MSDNKGRRAAFVVLVAIVVILINFLVFAEPLSPELSTVPVWKTELKAGPDLQRVDPGTGLLAFSAAVIFGYFSADGSTAIVAELPGGAAVNDSSYIAVAPGDQSRTLKSP